LHGWLNTMADTHGSDNAEGRRLRERPSAKPLHLNNSDDARQKVLKLNEEEDKGHGAGDGQKRTYGRTPDGTGT
jgi:phosphatidylethanolamine N-methyltransferase